MNRLLTRIFFCLALSGIATAASAADLPVLTVYTYNSFISDYGPGPEIKKAFEAECACRLDFVGVEDGVVLLSRLRLEGAQWLEPLGCTWGFSGGVISAGISAGLMCFKSENSATWRESRNGFLIVVTATRWPTEARSVEAGS